MQLTREQRELKRQRISAATACLNEALEDAYRYGMRARVISSGDAEYPVVNIDLMNPVILRFAEKAED